jgi:hypothetical protein
MQNVIIESDAQTLVSALSSKGFDQSELGMLHREIRSRMGFDSICCN